MKKVYCKDCKYLHITTSSDCYATIKEGKLREDFVTGGFTKSGIRGIVSCYDRNKNGKCKYFEVKE